MTVGMATVVITKRKKRARPSARNKEAWSEKTGKRSVTMGNTINRLSAKTRLIANAKTLITTTRESARLIGRINNAPIAPIENKLHPMRNKYCITLVPICKVFVRKKVQPLLRLIMGGILYLKKPNHRCTGFSDVFMSERSSVYGCRAFSVCRISFLERRWLKCASKLRCCLVV